MTTIVTRLGKGSALTHIEGDANFTNLNNNKVEHVPGLTNLRSRTPVNGEAIYLTYHTSVGDGGHGVFRGITGAALGTYTDDNGVTILPTGGDGSTAWIRERNSGIVKSEWYGLDTTGTTDESTTVASMQNILTADGGGILLFGPGTFKFNLQLASRISVKGHGQTTTIFTPNSDSAVFYTSLTSSSVFLSFEDFSITGNAAFTSNDGILLKTTTASTFVDTINIRKVRIQSCGRYGIRAEGTSVSGPFVQRMHIEDCTLTQNTNSGLSIAGTVLETHVLGTFIDKNGGSAGTNKNAEILLNTGSVVRVTFINSSLNHFNAVSIGNPGTALYIQQATEVNIIGCDFESADPFIHVTGASTRSTNILGNNFATGYAATDGIKIDDCNGFSLKGNTLQGGATITNGVVSTTAVNRTKKISISEIANTNTFLGTITNKIAITSNVTISTGTINAYKDFQRVDTEAAAATDDLDSIYDDSGTGVTTGLSNGQTITIRAQNGTHTVVVKHATGNIYLKGAADISLDQIWKTVTLQWDSNVSGWIEV